MKNAFFLGIILVIPIALVGLLLYSVGRFFYSLFTDVQLYRELNQIEAESQARRDQKQREGEQRLDNGCQHSFDAALGGFPPGVCPKCGLAQVKPSGKCDHVWRLTEGPVLASFCEKCGKEFRPQREA